MITDFTTRNAVSVKGFPRTLKWRVYRKEWDWAFYTALKHIAPQQAHKALMQYFTSCDTSGVMGNHIVRLK